MKIKKRELTKQEIIKLLLKNTQKAKDHINKKIVEWIEIEPFIEDLIKETQGSDFIQEVDLYSIKSIKNEIDNQYQQGLKEGKQMGYNETLKNKNNKNKIQDFLDAYNYKIDKSYKRKRIVYLKMYIQFLLKDYENLWYKYVAYLMKNHSHINHVIPKRAEDIDRFVKFVKTLSKEYLKTFDYNIIGENKWQKKK